MKYTIILILLTLIGCVDRQADNSVNNLTLQEIGQRMSGFWKLKRIENNEGVKEFDLSSDKLKYFEFNGLKGIVADFKDNHDGSFMTMESHEPTCVLKERGLKKIIEYSLIFNENWEQEIVKISQKELILIDSSNKWTYIRYKVD